MDHKVREGLRATSDHQDHRDLPASREHKEIPGLQVLLDLPVLRVQLDLLETPDILATVDFKVSQDLLGHWGHKDLKDQLDSRDSSALQDHQV